MNPATIYHSEADTKESVFTSNPRKHRITAIVPAVSGDGVKVGKQIVADACDGIIDRVRLIRSALTENPNWNIRLEENQQDGTASNSDGVLNLKYETHTIGALLKRVIFDLYPECSVNYEYLTHNYTIELHVASEQERKGTHPSGRGQD